MPGICSCDHSACCVLAKLELAACLCHKLGSVYTAMVGSLTKYSHAYGTDQWALAACSEPAKKHFTDHRYFLALRAAETDRREALARGKRKG